MTIEVCNLVSDLESPASPMNARALVLSWESGTLLGGARGGAPFSASGHLAAGSAPGGDRLDLDELVGETEDTDADERARRSPAAEAVLDHLPCGHEVGALA
jgi:hypothetical protein